MDFVCTQLVKLAQRHNIAVDSTAHTRKGELEAGNADNRRGASAQRDAGRLDYTLTHMSLEEAQQFFGKPPPDEYKDYIRLDRAKANIVRRSIKANWLRMASVHLDNGTELYPEGDNMQVVETWLPPAVWRDVTPDQVDLILDEIDRGMPGGGRYSAAGAAKARAAWRVVAKHCLGKAEAQCREIIKTWIANGFLVEEGYDDPTRREEAKGLAVDAKARRKAAEAAW